MIQDWVSRVLTRELGTLRDQIRAYDREDDLWRVVPGIANPAGVLALHLAGNLRSYIGAQLGHSEYRRHRELEFSARHVPRSEIVEEIDRATEEVGVALSALGGEALSADYPVQVGGVTLSTGQFLVHLACHLAYHLGQIDYHRRFLTGQENLQGALSVRLLAKPERQD